MTEPASVREPLAWDVLIKKRGSATQGVPAALDDLKWVANTATLLHGERDAVLVDTFLSLEQTGELADWIETFRRNLTTIYITHGHPDHLFGLKLLLDRFPEARAIAPAQVVAAMRRTIAPEEVANNWAKRWPVRFRRTSSRRT